MTDLPVVLNKFNNFLRYSVLTEVILYVEKIKFENPAIMEDKQCK